MSKPPPLPETLAAAPVIATWEYWSVAQMLVATHGDDAEAHVVAKLNEARRCGDEANVIVWTAIQTQLQRLLRSD